MKNQTYVILALLFIIFIAVFSVLNVSPVEVNYLFWQGESPLVIVILISVLLGGVLTTAFGAGKFISLRRENKQLLVKVHHLEKIIEQQTDIEINDSYETNAREQAVEANDARNEERKDGQVD
ncbi:MAG TPA: lipopolysaccharide assembly protein LapA domain-containing protein [Pseudogracilibacillus sp.]|nr:lipopolysaccharide assembly protein LapA domain-containing protein [Pseudogracilibacillus sp.]